MPTFEDPRRDADELGEAARGLAYATRHFARPQDSYEVLGSVHYALTSVQQSLQQIASFHHRHAGHAATDDGDPVAGREYAEKAGGWARLAAASLEQVVDLVMRAQGESSYIAWHPEPLTLPDAEMAEALRDRETALDPDTPDAGRPEAPGTRGLTR